MLTVAIAGSLHVYVDSQGIVYDATLNQTDIGANNNKFYYCQVDFFLPSRSFRAKTFSFLFVAS